MIGLTGRVPPFGNALAGSVWTLEELRSKSSKPLVVFPECTTSNGRGLLRFASVFCQNVPVKNYQVFVMNVRCVTEPMCFTAKFLTPDIDTTPRVCSHRP